MGKVLRAREMAKCIGCLSCMIMCSAVNQQSHSVQKSCISIRTYGGMEGRFIETVCAGCADPACAEACIASALKLRPGGGVLLSKEKCFGCRRCVQACPIGAVGFDEDAGNPLICRHCGVCVSFCPHGCLSLVELSVKE